MDVKVVCLAEPGMKAKEFVHQRCNNNYIAGLALVIHFGDLTDEVKFYKMLQRKWVPMTDKELLLELAFFLRPETEWLQLGDVAITTDGAPPAYCKCAPDGKFLKAIEWLKEEIGTPDLGNRDV